MLEPGKTVTAFFAECAKGRAEMICAFRSFFTPHTVWELIGAATTTGIDEAVAKVEATQGSYGMDHLFSEILAIAVSGNSVLTERIDNVRRADGTDLDSCRCMGIFEVSGDKILAWREYYDTASHG